SDQPAGRGELAGAAGRAVVAVLVGVGAGRHVPGRIRGGNGRAGRIHSDQPAEADIDAGAADAAGRVRVLGFARLVRVVEGEEPVVADQAAAPAVGADGDVSGRVRIGDRGTGRIGADEAARGVETAGPGTRAAVAYRHVHAGVRLRDRSGLHAVLTAE